MPWTQVNSMEVLYEFQQRLLQHVTDHFFRFLYGRLPLTERMIAIKGPRGSGKTTLLLQLLKFHFHEGRPCLYVTADHPYFYNHSLLDTATTFYQYAGRQLFIDEVHQYPNWSRELKIIYDGFPDLQVFISASSALDMFRGEADLSRRLLTYELPGMSFREYLLLGHGIELPTLTLEQLLADHHKVAADIRSRLQILPHFQHYLRFGYLPFIDEVEESTYAARLLEITNTVLERDLAGVQQYSAANVSKIKKVLGVIAESVPLEPNISRMAQQLSMGRDTISNYIQHLAQARLLNLVYTSAGGATALQKPDKIFLENTNLSFALGSRPEVGALRETFFVNQLVNAGYSIQLAKQGDFLVDKQYIFEVGGRHKTREQIKYLENAYVAADDIEIGLKDKIPLWLFGLLY